MDILVSGAGIAGLTLAFCLARLGHRPTVLEKAKEMKGGGYMIDFFGPGYDTAEALGLLPELETIHQPIRYFSFLSSQGREKFALEYRSLRKLFDSRHFNFLRGDLEKLLYEGVKDSAEIRFGTSVLALEQSSPKIGVVLTDGTRRSFDVVVGADGLRSRVRSLAFGPEKEFWRFLAYNVAAFMFPYERIPAIRPDAFQTLTVPGRQVAVYPVRERRIAAFLAYRGDELPDYSTKIAYQELSRVFRDMDWLVPQLLELSHGANELYFDAVAQIVMPSWSAGRVVLVGDAAWCLSLLAGQGASVAMLAAIILAEELEEPGAWVETALARYEQRLRPVVTARQVAGRRMADWFVPKSWVRLAVRDAMTRAASWPVVSSLVKRSLLLGSQIRPGPGWSVRLYL